MPQQPNKKFDKLHKHPPRKKTTTAPSHHPVRQKKQEIISVHQFSKISMTFWLGGTWMTGVVIFPLLFKMLDQVSAAQIVGQTLNLQAYIGLICLIIAFIEVLVNHRLALVMTKRFWYIISMGFILVINYFAVFPIIHNLRERLSSVAHQVIHTTTNVFDFWHSLSAILFILICIIGILYLLDM